MVNPAGQPRFPRHRNRTIVPKLIVLAGKDLMPDIFRFKSVRSKANLLVFLTPRVIKEPRNITELSADRKKKMDAFEEQNEREVEGAHPL